MFLMLLYLPLVDGAIASVDGVISGFLDGIHHVDITVIEGDDLHELVNLVPHLGSSEVISSSFRIFACRPLDAGDLLQISSSVHHEAHATSQVRLSDGGAGVSRSGGGSEGEDAEAEDQSLQTDKDKKVGQVEGQDLGGGGCSGQELECGVDQWVGGLFGVCGGQSGGHQGGSIEVFHREVRKVSSSGELSKKLLKFD